MLVICFFLCFFLAISEQGGYNNNNGQYHPINKPQPEPNRQIIQPRRPDLAVVDENKVQEFFERWCIYLKAGDINSMFDLYADDLVFIKSGKDIGGKQDIMDDITQMLNSGLGDQCLEDLSLISGDYYYPYYVGHSYKIDSYGQKVITNVFSDVMRLKANGDYEIILANIFDLNVEEEQNIPIPPSNGYGQPQETPKQKIKPPQPQINYYHQVQRKPELKTTVQYKITRPLPHIVPYNPNYRQNVDNNNGYN